MTSRWHWILCVFLVAGVRGGADERRPMIPKQVQQAEQQLTKWLKKFEGQTAEMVRKTLGPPDEEDSWEFEKKQEPVLKYNVTDTTKLTIFFHQGQVVTSSLLVLP